MKRLMIVLALTLLLPMLLIADPEAFISSYSNCFSVNLASESFGNHRLTETWDNGYVESQLFATIGIRGMPSGYGKNLELEVNFVSVTTESWCYVYDGNDTRYLRPFGVDAFARKKIINGGHNKVGENGMGGGHFGIQQLIAGQAMNDGNTITLNASDISDAEAVWWDIALVFYPDNITNGVLDYNNRQYYLTVGDTYTATIELTVRSYTTDSEGNKVVDIEMTHVLHLSGYYNGTTTDQTTSNDTLISNLTVTKTAEADAVDIAQMLEDNSSSIVGQYSFVTNTLGDDRRSHANDNIYMFLSSSSSGSVSGDQFTLRHTNIGGATSARDTAHNAVRFTATITSTSGHKNGDTTNTITYDGSDIWTNTNNSNYLVIPPQFNTGPNGDIKVLWQDTGDISISIPSGQTINGTEVNAESLMAGLYTSNIYVYVIVFN